MKLLFVLFVILIKGYLSFKSPIFKFGGSSLSDVTNIKNVCSIIDSSIKEYQYPVVVLSAIGDTTNKLLEASELALKSDDINESKRIIYNLKNKHNRIYQYIKNNSKSNNQINSEELILLKKEIDNYFDNINDIMSGIHILRELSPLIQDLVCSFGERLSVRLVSSMLNNLYFEKSDFNSQHFDSWDIGLKTYGDFGDSKFMEDYIMKLNVDFKIDSLLNEKQIPIITGFICKNEDGKITTLGRGGSDLTATFIGECCNSYEIQVWKDVDGLMTADPKYVKNAKPVSKLSYEQASELAYFGAKILHPISMLPATRSKIPVRIKNSYNRSCLGTVISNDKNNDYDKELIIAMTEKKDITLIDVVSTRMLEQSGFLSKVFKVFEEENVSIDVIATSDISISLTLDSKNNISKNAVSRLQSVANVNVKTGFSIISLISNLEKSSIVLEKVFKILSRNNINIEMISQGASKVNISLVLKSEDVLKSMNLIHDEFF